MLLGIVIHGLLSFMPIPLPAVIGNFEIGRMLLAGGVDVNRKNRDEARPLYAATFTGHSALLEFLLSKWARPAGEER